MDKKKLQNKIDNLDELISKSKKTTYQTYLQKTKTTCQRRAQENNY